MDRKSTLSCKPINNSLLVCKPDSRTSTGKQGYSLQKMLKQQEALICWNKTPKMLLDLLVLTLQETENYFSQFGTQIVLVTLMLKKEIEMEILIS